MAPAAALVARLRQTEPGAVAFIAVGRGYPRNELLDDLRSDPEGNAWRQIDLDAAAGGTDGVPLTHHDEAVSTIREAGPRARWLVLTSIEQPHLALALEAFTVVATYRESDFALVPHEVRRLLSDAGVTGEAILRSMTHALEGCPRAVSKAVSLVASGTSVHEVVGIAAQQIHEHMWATLSDTERDLLLATAWLPHVHPRLVTEVFGQPDPLRVLEGLASRHHALYLPSGREAWGYWPREALLTHYMRSRTTEPAPDVLRRAADWFGQRGDVDAQVTLLAQCGALSDASELIRVNENLLFEQGRIAELARWYQLVPAPHDLSDPEAMLRGAWVKLLEGDVSGARRGAVDAGSGTRSGGAATDANAEASTLPLQVEFASLRAEIELRSARPVAALQHAERASSIPLTGTVTNGQAIAAYQEIRALLWLGRLGQAQERLTAAASAPATPLVTHVVRPTIAAALQVGLGHVNAALYGCREVLAVKGLDRAPSRLTVLTVEAACLVDLGQFVEAASAIKEARSEAEVQGHRAIQVLLLLLDAQMRAVSGARATALDELRSAMSLVAGPDDDGVLATTIQHAEARVRLMGGDVVRAQRCLAHSTGVDADLLKVRIMQVRRPGSGATLLRTIHPLGPRQALERRRLELEIQGIRTPTTASHALIDWADEAMAEGLFLALVGSSERLLASAEGTASRSGHAGLARMVELARPAHERSRVVRSLSRGELELLAILPTGATYAQIADEFSVSVNTIKTRLRRLYAKLGAHHRPEAIAAARAAGLLPIRPGR